ncbi:hypothetical protein, partial [Xylella fastidiosa]|uniref:hypothetical protein n=1 Tax=Xylella fastidiosa TaxID=2371 RepID=UPI001CA3B127
LLCSVLHSKTTPFCILLVPRNLLALGSVWPLSFPNFFIAPKSTTPVKLQNKDTNCDRFITRYLDHETTWVSACTKHTRQLKIKKTQLKIKKPEEVWPSEHKKAINACLGCSNP